MWCTTRLYFRAITLLVVHQWSTLLSKQNKTSVFADDTNLTASANPVTDLEAAVNSDLENLRKWLIANKLSLNVAETWVYNNWLEIHDTKNISNPHPNVFIENKQIKQVYECKTLGVKIDQHLSWKGNTDEIREKVSAGISSIRRIKPFVDQETLILIYNAIVRPYFDYCCEVWDVFSEAQSKRLQKLQNRAARIILNVNNFYFILQALSQH